MSAHPLPWSVAEPYVGCNGARVGHTVIDNDGNQVCECIGDDGREEALLIATTVNRSGPAVCAFCGKPATCFGAYEDGLSPVFGCDECCGHGGEDGHCEPVPNPEAE